MSSWSVGSPEQPPPRRISDILEFQLVVVYSDCLPDKPSTQGPKCPFVESQ